VVGINDDASTQLPVLLLELGYSALEVGELRFALVAGVLCGDTIAMRSGLLAVVWSDGIGACPLS
jgi:hypothetical protein